MTSTHREPGDQEIRVPTDDVAGRVEAEVDGGSRVVADVARGLAASGEGSGAERRQAAPA